MRGPANNLLELSILSKIFIGLELIIFQHTVWEKGKLILKSC
jgi:hypothetical protein